MILDLDYNQWCIQDFSNEGARRRRRRGVSALEEAGPSQEKIILPQNGTKFWRFFMQFFNRQKTRTVALGDGFYGSVAKQSLQKQCKKLLVRSGGQIIAPPPLNTPLITTRRGHCTLQHA